MQSQHLKEQKQNTSWLSAPGCTFALASAPPGVARQHCGPRPCARVGSQRRDETSRTRYRSRATVRWEAASNRFCHCAASVPPSLALTASAQVRGSPVLSAERSARLGGRRMCCPRGHTSREFGCGALGSGAGQMLRCSGRQGGAGRARGDCCAPRTELPGKLSCKRSAARWQGRSRQKAKVAFI